MKGKPKREFRTAKFKEQAVQRMLAGESVSRLSRELKVKRSLLYRWRATYRKAGVAGFRPVGRAGWSQAQPSEQEQARIAQLERKVGQQTLVIDFLRRACKRVAAFRQPSNGTGATASMERSRP